MNSKYFMLILVVAAFTLMGSQAAAAMTSKQIIVQEQGSYRTLHFVLRGVSLERAYWMVDEPKHAHFNGMSVQITDGVQLKHAPLRAKAGARPKEEYKKWADYANSIRIQVILELKLISHQENFYNVITTV